MCKYVIIDKVLAEKVADDIVKEMIDDRVSNPHGSGIYFFNRSKNNLFVKHWYGKTPDEEVEKVLEDCISKFTKGSLLVYHNRYATSGSQSKSQCHPIPIEHCDEYGKNIYEGWYVIHNGILPKYEVEGINNLSDTQIVGRVLGQWMYDHDIHSPHEFGNKRWKEFWEIEFSGNKVTIVHNSEYYTINANLGVVEDGIWKTCSKSITTYGCGYGGYEYWTEKEKKAYEQAEHDYWEDQFQDHRSVVDKIAAIDEESGEVIPDYDPKFKN